MSDFSKEAVCTYKGEKYTARDNGEVLKHPRDGKRVRPTDAKWTFGKPNSKTGYMEIASVRVHRIVTTAFHGEPPTPEHVVDHIDTNRQNNRPENLRWLTRLENALKNPITRRRIELVCGSIEAFIEDPSILGNSSVDSNFKWMRTVTPKEAKASRERLEMWAESDKPPSGGSLGEWVFEPISNSERDKDFIKPAPPRDLSTPLARDLQKLHRLGELLLAKTQGAAQRNWNVSSEFPCCPQVPEKEPIQVYADALIEGSIFARNDFSETKVLKTVLVDNDLGLLVMGEQTEKNAVKPWSLAKVTFEDDLYVHESLGMFFDINGAEKYFTLGQGLKWEGGDSIDDYC